MYTNTLFIISIGYMENAHSSYEHFKGLQKALEKMQHSFLPF